MVYFTLVGIQGNKKTKKDRIIEFDGADEELSLTYLRFQASNQRAGKGENSTKFEAEA